MIEEVAIAWPAPEVVPILGAGAIHVWGWRLDVPPGSLTDAEGEASAAELAALGLGVPEIARARQMRFGQHRARFVAAHVGLRRILGGYLQVDPSLIDLEAEKHGKPRLVTDSGLQFNLSHSGDVAVLAVSLGIEVGVDVEFIRPALDGIAERFFSVPEVAALAELPQGERLAAFYAVWTRKEAFLKGLGVGLAGGLDSFATSLPGQGPPRVWEVGSNAGGNIGPGITAGWGLAHLEPAAGYVGAVAFQAESCSVQCFAASV